MSLFAHILFMIIAALLAWLSWLLVLFNVNPLEAAWWGFLLFYLTLFLALFGTLGVLGFLVRSITRMRRMTIRYRVATSLRQASLWSLALIIALALQAQRVLSWWIFFLILIVFVLVEFIWSSLQHRVESE